jgi:hypothetical protein
MGYIETSSMLIRNHKWTCYQRPHYSVNEEYRLFSGVYSRQGKVKCETSFGYTGVNIKFQLTKDLALMNIRKLTCNPVDGIWSSSMTTYSEHLDGLSEKARNAKLKNPRYNTFLVFHSGKVIMSGVSAEYMKDVYYDFREMISSSRDEIEERLFM